MLASIRQTRDGCLNDPRFGHRMLGSGTAAELLQRRFRIASRRLGLRFEPEPLETGLFRVPNAGGGQPTLFD